MPVKNRFSQLLPQFVKLRREFHSNPELGYDVNRTAERVANLLREYGCDEVIERIGKTGVVGVIRGVGTGTKRVIGLRADMDALPIREETGLEYASINDGKMHACGHDGHTTMLLAAAKYLCETRNFDGSAALIFQPAEEGGAGGREMCRDGLMERFGINEVYSLHNAPGLPIGHFAIRPGAFLASSHEFEIQVTGKGGHAAVPEEAIDTTLIAAHILTAIQSVVSRNTDPLKRLVVTIATFETDSSAPNIIANKVIMRGTLRSLDDDCTRLASDRISNIAQGTANAFGASATTNWTEGYPATINTEENTRYAVEAARQISDHVDANADPLMPVEDFSYMLLERPGAYILIGNGDTAECHHPAYDFNDEAIVFGASWYCAIVENRMPLQIA